MNNGDLCGVHFWRLKTHGSFELPGDNPPFGMKWCYKCKRYVPKVDFYANARKGGRLESPCKACRSAFTKLYRKKRPGNISSERNRRRRALEHQARSEPYTAEEIAERDGWRCQICGKRIGRMLKFPHPRSLSMDHIVPISCGGDDLKVNVQAAHFSCNASKRDRGTDQLRLIG